MTTKQTEKELIITIVSHTAIKSPLLIFPLMLFYYSICME